MKILNHLSKKSFFLGIITVLFLAKSIFFISTLPFFQGPDEQVHYATVQYLAEPKEKTWEIKTVKPVIGKDDIEYANFSQELTQTAEALKFDDIKWQKMNTQEFSWDSDTGSQEIFLAEANLFRYIDTLPTNISGTKSWYYSLGADIEQLLSNQDIFTRIFSVRFLSVILGLLTVFFAFLTFQKIGFSEMESAVLTALVALQPGLMQAAGVVNIDIALILSFAIFSYTGISLLKEGSLAPKWIILSLASAILGFTAKGPGLVLIGAFLLLMVFIIWKHYRFDTKKYILSIVAIALAGGALVLVVAPEYIASITASSNTSKFSSVIESLDSYQEKTLDMGEFRETALSYWGNFGWLDTRIGSNVFEVIWLIEELSLIGLLLFFIPWSKLSEKIKGKIPATTLSYLEQKRDFLPEKRFIIALFILIFALQFAIRFFDWRIYDAYGKILIGTPGRYFLPNIVGHIAILTVGLGYFCRSKASFHTLLKTLLVSMIFLNAYIFLDILIPRYYL